MTIIDDLIADLAVADATKKRNLVDAVRLAFSNIDAEDATTAQTQRDTNMTTANNWFDSTVLPTLFNPPITRFEAYQNFNDIDVILQSETDKYRILVLQTKKQEAEQTAKVLYARS